MALNEAARYARTGRSVQSMSAWMFLSIFHFFSRSLSAVRGSLSGRGIDLGDQITIPSLSSKLRSVVAFGCGSAGLRFGVHRFLGYPLGITVKIHSASLSGNNSYTARSK